ncbi:AraC family transcriptional regulator [Halalkalibacter flavus]|uniref:AraC family transcriptional regulator n=1 Tax=Halalkalibacter flavus TaxID=3090668 RepID=UPI002FC75AB4
MNYSNDGNNWHHQFLQLRKVDYDKISQERSSEWHYHKELEVLLVLSGKIELLIENEVLILNEGDFVLIGSNQLHKSIKHDLDNLQYIVFQFDVQQYIDQTIFNYLQHFSETHKPLSFLNYIFEKENVKSNFFNCIMEIYKENKNKDKGYEIAISLLIRKMLLILIRNDYKQILDITYDKDYKKLKPALDYIEDHLGERLDLNHISSLVNLSYFYFSRQFKKIIGMSLTDYINFKRIKKAERLLLTENISIVETSTSVGIPNISHFYNLFKRHNQCSPNQFIKQLQGNDDK